MIFRICEVCLGCVWLRNMIIFFLSNIQYLLITNHTFKNYKNIFFNQIKKKKATFHSNTFFFFFFLSMRATNFNVFSLSIFVAVELFFNFLQSIVSKKIKWRVPLLLASYGQWSQLPCTNLSVAISWRYIIGTRVQRQPLESIMPICTERKSHHIK